MLRKLIIQKRTVMWSNHLKCAVRYQEIIRLEVLGVGLCDEQLHDELTRKEMARLKALEAIAGGITGKSAPPIAEGAISKIFDDLNLLDDNLFSDIPVNSNHPINSQSEGITVQA